MKDDDGWIEWHGEVRPVGGDVVVDVQYRNGDSHQASAGTMPWGHYARGHDIVRYRIAKPAEPTAPDTTALNALWHQYAGKAMQGFLARDEIFVDMRAGLDDFARGAADMADAMLAESRKRGRA